MLDSNTTTTWATLARAPPVQTEGPSNPAHQPAESNQTFEEQRLDIQRQQRTLDDQKRTFAAYISNHPLIVGRPIIHKAPQEQNLLGGACAREIALACVMCSLVIPVIRGPGYNPSLVVSTYFVKSRRAAEVFVVSTYAAPIAILKQPRLRTPDVPLKSARVYSESLRIDPGLLPPYPEQGILVGHDERLARKYKAGGHYYPCLVRTNNNTELFRQINEHLLLRGAKPSDLPRFSIGEPLVERIRIALLLIGWITPLFTRFSGKSDPDLHLMEYRTLMAPNNTNN